MESDFELLPIPEGAVSVDLDIDCDNWDLVVEALRVKIDEWDLKNLIKLKKVLNYSEKFISVNKFFTQIIFCGLFDNEVNISMNQWLEKGKTPQLILAAQIDDENNIVNFIGTITSKEFKDLLLDKQKVNLEISLPISKFTGGIDLFFYYVQFLDTNLFPRTGFNKSLVHNKNELNFDENHAADSVSTYLTYLGKIKPLHIGEEIELANNVQAMKKSREIPRRERSPDNIRQIMVGKQSRDRMMEANLRLVVSVAKLFQNHGLFFSELMQAGLSGLEIAVDTFDPEMGYKFSSFAYWCIRSGIINELDAYKESIPKSNLISLEQKNKLDGSNNFDDLENFLKSQVFRYMKEYKITNAFFEKDNDRTSRRTVSYIFREFDNSKHDNLSIFFKVISTGANGINKFKNEDFFEELNKDRIQKSCEYAVLVSLLEQNNEIYNSGIVDVSNRFSEMYVVRPESLVTIISLLKNIFLEADTVEKRNTLISAELDIKSFVQNLSEFKEENNFQEFTGLNNNIKALGEQIPYPKDQKLMEDLDKTLQKEDLGNWLSQLNETEQKIMKLRFGLDGEEQLTLSEIGRKINVSRERVKQIEAKAILKLRVEAQYLNPLFKNISS